MSETNIIFIKPKGVQISFVVMSTDAVKYNFSHFLNKFPEIELPVVLTEDLSSAFSLENEPLPELMIRQFIQRYEPGPVDEFTEYVPCFRLSGLPDFHALVYWKAELLLYEYYLATYDKAGELIDRAPLCGTKVEGSTLLRSVATIEPSRMIFVVEGVVPENDADYVADSSKSRIIEITDQGIIER